MVKRWWGRCWRSSFGRNSKWVGPETTNGIQDPNGVPH
jgi:hypothetical protein